MKKILTIFLLLATLGCAARDEAGALPPLRTGAERIAEFMPDMSGRKIGVVCNHTSVVGDKHLVDTLVAAGANVVKIFAPEHGFRGDADAGARVANTKDKATGLPVISLYGSNKKPAPADLAGLDMMLFDMQDVGLRFYTYLSTLHYVMEACAENDLTLVLLDRPNPNGMYVDGPVLDMKNRSFVGMHPIPVVHGMTLGELARMINGEQWLAGGRRCRLDVIECEGYTRAMRYEPPIAPSPNLPNLRSIYLYPSLCLFEATPMSIGRGTDFPFQVFGHPELKYKGYQFSFTPRAVRGAANPPLKDVLCYGMDLRNEPDNDYIIAKGIDLSYLIEAYNNSGAGEKFLTPFFEKLIGVDWVRPMIVGGYPHHQIKERWQNENRNFIQKRKPYLLYD